MAGVPQNADDNAAKNMYREPLATDSKLSIGVGLELDGEDDVDD